MNATAELTFVNRAGEPDRACPALRHGARWRSIYDTPPGILSVLETPGDIVGFIRMEAGGILAAVPRTGRILRCLDLETAATYVETFIPERLPPSVQRVIDEEYEKAVARIRAEARAAFPGGVL